MEVIMSKDRLEWFHNFSLLYPLLDLLPASWNHFWSRLLIIDIVVSAQMEPALCEKIYGCVKECQKKKNPAAVRSPGFPPSASKH